MRWLSKDDIESVVPPPLECAAVIRQTLQRHARGELEMPPKSGVHPPAGRHVHSMSAFIPHTGALGMKWIADFPCNPARGLPTLNAVIILNDPDTGIPTSLMDGAPITSARTAAMTCVSLEACANPRSRVVGIIGTGVQARAHVKALPAVFPALTEIRVAGLLWSDAVQFCEELGDARLRPVPNREQAARDSDIVITVTNSVNEPLLEPDWLKAGVTVVVLDNGGKETRILGFFDRIITDDRRPFSDSEAQRRFPGGVPPFDAEIGEILLGTSHGRTSDLERILILNLGLGACDVAIAHEIYKRAEARNLGINL